MRSQSVLSLILASTLGIGVVAAPAFVSDAIAAKAKAKTKAKKKKAPVAKTPAAPAPRKVPVVSADSKKKLAGFMGEWKFGMSKEEVVAVFSKSINAKYDDRIKETTDVTAQDRLRRDRKNEIAKISASYVAFDGKRTGWDVSIVEDEFIHKTGESMLEQWENKDGKNQRRFFFFHEGKLYKMFISLDLSILPEDKRNTETFLRSMQDAYGAGLVEGTTISWSAGDFQVRAIDKLKTLSALGIAIEDTGKAKEIIALREANAPKKVETNAIIKAVVDKDGTDAPDVKSNSGAVDAVIKAQGGTKR